MIIELNLLVGVMAGGIIAWFLATLYHYFKNKGQKSKLEFLEKENKRHKLTIKSLRRFIELNNGNIQAKVLEDEYGYSLRAGEGVNVSLENRPELIVNIKE